MSAEARSIPASVTPFDGHGLPAWESRTGALRFWLMIGTLDSPDVRELHPVLGAQARVCPTADLAGLDYQHYPTAAAVLWVAARKMQDGLPRARCTLITGRRRVWQDAAGAAVPGRGCTGVQGPGGTAMTTVCSPEDIETAVGVSSRADTWLLPRNVESNGKSNRLLSVLKQRGSAHSDQFREFVLTDHGVELADVYVGPGGADRPGLAQPGNRRARRQAAVLGGAAAP
jgi:hypothetical protein